MLRVTNLTKTAVDKKLLTGVAKVVLKGENKGTKKEISVVFVNSGKIRELNRKYRGLDKSTDILSFEGEKSFLGEIFICLTEVKKNTEETNRSFKKELVFVFIHGLLHLLGYDHERSKDETEKMQNREKYYLSQINF